MNKKQSRLGLGLVILSGFAFGVTPSLVSFCYTQGATPQLVILFRYLILTFALLPFMLRQKGVFTTYKKNFGKLLFLSAAGASTPVLLYTSYRYLPTSLSTTIHYLYPALVALICVVVFREKLSKLRLLCLCLCAGGILLMLDLTGAVFSPFGIVVALFSSLTWAIYIAYLGKLDLENVTSLQIIFYVAINSVFLIFLYALVMHTFPVHMTPVGWAAMLGADVITAILGSLCFALGVRYTDPQLSSIASTLEPITSIFIGIIFLHEVLTLKTGIGSVLILAAVILLSIFNA